MLPTSSFRRPLTLLLASTLLLLNLAFTQSLFARAGGGENFSSGSSSSSNSSSSSGSRSSSPGYSSESSRREEPQRDQGKPAGPPRPMTLLEKFCLFCCFVPAGLFLLYAFIFGKKVPKTLNAGQRAKQSSASDAAISTIKNTDPSFSPDRFNERVKLAFEKVQAGWSHQNIGVIRSFTSDGVVERFALQFQEQIDEGYRNKMDNVIVDEPLIVDATVGPFFEAVTVLVGASAQDTNVDLQTGRHISGDFSPQTFSEYWSFLRRRGGPDPATEPRQGLIEGVCPNCGTRLNQDGLGPRSLKCPSCSSALFSGTHDWVLAEISQVSVKQTSAVAPVPQSVVLYQKSNDPGISTAHLEDRASLVFWRWAKSLRVGDTKPLRKVATPEFCETIAKTIDSQTDPSKDTRTFYGKCGVGGVQTLGIIPGPNVDRAFILVEWSGQTLSTSIQPAQPREYKPVPDAGIYCTSLLTLKRNAGVSSNPQHGLSSAHCPTCGGPETDETLDSCSYCGTILNDGSADWVLAFIHDSRSQAAKSIMGELSSSTLRQQTNPGSPSAFDDSDPRFSTPSFTALWLARLMLSDKVLTDSERKLFHAFCTRHKIRGTQAQAMLDTARKERAQGLVPPPPSGEQEARQWLALLANAIYIAGAPTSDDQRLLLIAAERLHLSEKDAQQANNAARAEALALARQAIQGRKRS